MPRFDLRELTTRAVHDRITIRRNEHGVPTVTASNREDLCFGIGYAHAVDRLVQMILVRTIAYGRSSERFTGSDELIELDTFMRRLCFERGLDAEMARLTPAARNELTAYATGINAVLSTKRRPLEFLLVGHRPEPWQPCDSLITAKVMGYIGLAQAQEEADYGATEHSRSRASPNRAPDHGRWQGCPARCRPDQP